ncbi:MAG: IS5 family transposase [Acidobacteria bacterium]|nr:IS5 family transposase [Acidobacteriota bacterium]
MYKVKDRKTLPLFPELFPFGGKLNEKNRWLRISELIPWDDLEEEYAKKFSDMGRPAKDGQLVIGLLLLKHMTGLSDEGVVTAVMENPYMQAFCGFEKFVTEEILDSSTLTKMRKRLGLEFFRQLERKTYKLLIDQKIIKAMGMLIDATVFPENIKYPNDVGLLNDVREWLVDNIKKLGKAVGKTYRSKPRVARKEYLNYSKKKNKTKKTINNAKKKMLQHVKRNLKQMKNVIEFIKAQGWRIKQNIIDKIDVAKKIYSQQWEMYKKKVNRIEDRIVSFHRPYVRPIKRGKSGKPTEFGAKGALSNVDGFLFLDHLEHAAFSEDKWTETHIKAYKEKFGKGPPYISADQKYGSRDNRKLLDKEEIRVALKPLGRKPKGGNRTDRWIKAKQKERNRIEGSFGHGKQHFGMDRVKYQGNDGSEIWTRCCLLAMNLQTAVKKA